MPKTKRTYRKHFVASWGETIVGLTKSADGRFRPIGRSTPAWSARDEAKAIHKFRMWQAEQSPTLEPLDLDDEGISFGPTNEGHWYAARYFHELLIRDPRQAAIELDDDRLARLPELGAREPSFTLAELVKTYRNKRPPLSTDWKRKAKLFWTDFAKIVKAETVRDITPDDIARYGDTILDRPQAPTYSAHRFGLVKSVLNYALKRGKDIDQLGRVLTLCKMLESPRKNGTDPKPIEPAHFQALLDVSNYKWRAIFLLSLNAALYPSEVAAVKRSHVDLKKGTLVMDRGKTGVPRIAVLWERTVAAIRTYLAESGHQSPSLFVSQTGAPYNGNHVGRNFRRRRFAADLPESVEFAHIRDGSYTAAVESGVDALQAAMIAGHSSGMKDHYVKRGPRMVADACAAIEHHFFGE